MITYFQSPEGEIIRFYGVLPAEIRAQLVRLGCIPITSAEAQDIEQKMKQALNWLWRLKR